MCIERENCLPKVVIVIDIMSIGKVETELVSFTRIYSSNWFRPLNYTFCKADYLQHISTAAYVLPIPDSSGVFQLHTPPKHFLRFLYLPLQLIRSCEREPCFTVIPSSTKSRKRAKEKGGAITSCDAVLEFGFVLVCGRTWR